MHWLQLFLAVMAEVIGTTALKATVGFTRPGPIAVALVSPTASPSTCWRGCFLVLPLGVTYAIWSGFGVAAVTVIGWTVYGQRLDCGGLARHRPDRGRCDGA
jgi:small multidrug resistance pump